MYKGSEVLILDRQEQEALHTYICTCEKGDSQMDRLPLTSGERETIRELLNLLYDILYGGSW